MLESFYAAYLSTYGEECPLDHISFRKLMYNHPKLGDAFSQLKVEETEAFLLMYMPEILTYVYQNKPEEGAPSMSLFPTFRAAYREAFGEDCGLDDGELSLTLTDHQTLGKNLFGFRHDQQLMETFVAQNMSAFLTYINICVKDGNIHKPS